MKRIPVSTALVLLVVLCLSAAAMAQGRGARPLEIYFVDVEGGAATLVVTPAGESMLVDAGWEREDNRDAKRIFNAARAAGLKRIDHLLVTHYHVDHWGALGALRKMIPIGAYYDRGRVSELAEDKKHFPRLNAAYEEATGGKSRELKPGDTIPLRRARGAAPIGLRVVAANGNTLQADGPENPECTTAELKQDDLSDNARSVGFVLSLGKFRFVDLGDLTWNIEHKLACPANVIGKATLYQVTHHGLNNSNNPVLLRAIQPQVAVTNNGPRKGGHPDVLGWLRAVRSVEDVYQVHRNIATSDEENVAPEFIANLGPEDGCEGHYIKVTVAPDGNSFTVTNGRTGQSRSYAVK
jgi:competence protein ComEC